MIWIIAILVIAIMFFRFFSDLNKDNDDLQGKPLAEKFSVIVRNINDSAFNGVGQITELDKREFNLYEDGKNQIIFFHYSTGHLTITWKYKYFQKEIIHKRQFDDVRNLSIFEQQKIAEQMINEMKDVVQQHMKNILGNL